MIRNEILEAEGVVPDYEDGIRITDAKTLQIARVSFVVHPASKLTSSEYSYKRT
jgi:N-acetyl-gamma-glutamyl-phosphate reductase/acetylglutamate kinase